MAKEWATPEYGSEDPIGGKLLEIVREKLRDLKPLIFFLSLGSDPSIY